MQVSWAILKNFVIAKGVCIQWLDLTDSYFLKATDGVFLIETSIFKADAANSDLIDFETNFKNTSNKVQSQASPAFKSKTLSNGKGLYKREQGIQADVVVGTNDIRFTIPYALVKIIGVEIMNGEVLDTVDFLVLDSTTGTYSGTANAVLNQFGYSVNISAGLYEETNSYDAELRLNMQIKLVYTSKSAKRIGINFNLNEVK